MVCVVLKIMPRSRATCAATKRSKSTRAMALEPLAWHPHATTDDRLAMAALEAAQTTASMGSTMATPMHRGNRKTQRHAHLFFARELQTGSTRQRTKAVGEQCPRTLAP